MIKATIFPGRYVQGADALNSLGKELKRFGENAFIITDPFVYENIIPSIKDSLLEEVSAEIIEFSEECSDEEIDRLSDKATSKADVLVGIGGGKTLDTAKAVAHNLKIPVAVVPTIASTDAPCSALSVIYTPEGEFKRYLFLPKNPDLVLVDSKVIASAPARFLVSGMGDALATWFEARSCEIGNAKNMTGNPGSMTAYSLARLCYETLLKYGEQAKNACQAQVVTSALEKVIEANTLLSGLGFESGGLAAAHAIHNGLTILQETHEFFHGEKVAFGTLASLFLTEKDPAVIDEVFYFCETVGLPTTLEGIGLGNATYEQLMKVAETSSAEGETIHNELVEVTPETVFSALKAADAYGKYRLQE
ncbi:glycerol dehydrogenase [Mesotoga sp. UBA5557]|jgi:glycerol dehydrogenase|uniref:glycerol dehydrogenase n=2 Tax=unclassified Mesotoga TaxID=1184398 RepID=UPI002600FDBA|nr:glycerol dehydrogenase [Mesotoga sp. UBA5557]